MQLILDYFLIIECPSHLHVVASAAASLPSTALHSLPKREVYPSAFQIVFPVQPESLPFQISGAHGLHHRYGMSSLPGILYVWVQVLALPPEYNPNILHGILSGTMPCWRRKMVLPTYSLSKWINKINKNKNRAIREKRKKQRKDHHFLKEWKIILLVSKMTT